MPHHFDFRAQVFEISPSGADREDRSLYFEHTRPSLPFGQNGNCHSCGT